MLPTGGFKLEELACPSYRKRDLKRGWGLAWEGKANGATRRTSVSLYRVETGRVELPVQRDPLGSFHRLTASELARSGQSENSSLLASLLDYLTQIRLSRF